MKIAIIGTGPSGIGALEEIYKTKNEIHVFDIGVTIPKDIDFIKNKLQEKDINNWTIIERKKITFNPTINKFIPKKTTFGSEYPYHYDSDIKLKNVDCYASQAKGGFFNVWGAAMLPISKIDIKDWPINLKDLKKYYERSLKSIPYSFRNDEINRFFKPYTKKNPNPIKIPMQAKNFISAVNNLNSNLFFCGQSRLAVYLDGKKKCKYCGTCLTGCVFDSIYNSHDNLNDLLSKKNVTYRKNTKVIKYTELNNKVKVFFESANSKNNYETFDKIFIAAGPLSTAKIVMNSNKNINEVIFSDSQKFIIPIFTFDRLKTAISKLNSLCAIFFEYNHKNKSIIHTQISHYNELIKQKIPVPIKPYLSFITERIMIGWGGINSKFSHKILFYRKNKLFYASRKKNPRTFFFIMYFSLIFFITMLRIGRISTPFAFFAKTGGGSHFGSSFPMKNIPSKLNETDINGKLFNHKNTYIIDASVLPSIPSTTLALTVIANAKRIVSNVLK